MSKVQIHRDDTDGEYRLTKDGEESSDTYLYFHDALHAAYEQLPDGGTVAVPYAHAEAVTKTDVPDGIAIVEEGDDVGQVKAKRSRKKKA